MPKSPEPEKPLSIDEQIADDNTRFLRARMTSASYCTANQPVVAPKDGDSIRARHNRAHAKDQSLTLRKELNGKGEKVEGDIEDIIHDTIRGNTR